jgi:hypothetical protein
MNIRDTRETEMSFTRGGDPEPENETGAGPDLRRKTKTGRW